MIIFACIFCASIYTSCQLDDASTDGKFKLTYATDTLTFDTVFTTVGSATRYFTIRNTNDEAIRIGQIELAKGSQTIFRLNVDGVTGNLQNDILVPANDSIYVFVDVTVNPDQPVTISPFIVDEEIIVRYNGNEDRIVLEAFGQNANYIPSNANQGGFFLINQNTTWSDPKPYVIYGVVLVDSSTLTIPAGARIYVHGGLAKADPMNFYNDGQIIILPNGRLKVEGTPEQPVTFQGDRLESSFSDVRGQWGGIRLAPGSTGNSIRGAKIVNSSFGVFADSTSSLTISQTQISNSSLTNLICEHAYVTASNCLFFDAGSHAAILTFGGNYKFSYCTFSGNQSSAESVRFDNAKAYDPLGELILVNDINIQFLNCILWGRKKDELLILDATGGAQPSTLVYQFDHTLVQVDELVTGQNGIPDFFDHCSTCYEAAFGDRLFTMPDESDYSLDSLSIAIEKGVPIPGISIDLKGISRDPVKPDLGSLEKVD
ncbi:MAG: right-handed parallel beta-helix repeat-containing protein [Saprospiraceae bacterium]